MENKFGFLYTDKQQDSQIARELLAERQVEIVEYDFDSGGESILEAPTLITREGDFRGLVGIRGYIEQIILDPE